MPTQLDKVFELLSHDVRSTHSACEYVDDFCRIHKLCAIDPKTVMHELAANAVKHAASKGDFAVVVHLFNREIPEIAVWDHLPCPRPVTTKPNGLAESGRGLLMVQGLTSRFVWQSFPT